MSGVAHADVTGNIAVVSKYVLRGITNDTESDTATLQGGFDYAHSSGVYVGYWGSGLDYADKGVEKFRANKNRIYLTGLSMGGSGSWRMAADHPERFAAVVPICGRGALTDADKLKSLPIWVFCGDQDGVFKQNEELVQAVKKSGSQSIRFTSLENIGHNSWSAAYATPDLYQWLDRQTREKK